MGHIRITIDGRLALTVEQAAERHGLRPSSVRAIITRTGLQPADVLDGKKKLYLAADFDAAVKNRPGRGRSQSQ